MGTQSQKQLRRRRKVATETEATKFKKRGPKWTRKREQKEARPHFKIK